MSVSKRIPWKGEQRYFQFRGELYNAEELRRSAEVIL